MIKRLFFCFAGVLMTVNGWSSVLLKVIEISDNWKFRQIPGKEWLSASVPGCVHTDLLNNNKIEDPFYRTNEENLQWIGEKDWEYSTVFQVQKDLLQKENVELIFDGLDTYADVFLNDALILSADNMQRTWKVDVKNLLNEGDNKLRIYFHSVFKEGKKLLAKSPFPLFQFPNNDRYHGEYICEKSWISFWMGLGSQVCNCWDLETC